MKIHVIQTGTIAFKRAQRKLLGPPATRIVSTFLDWRYTEPLPIYAWMIEHPEGIIVVDTGSNAGTQQRDYFDTDWEYRAAMRLGRLFRYNVQREQEIGLQLKALGINSRRDVRWVVLTHLHADHVDGLRYFPTADIAIAHAEFSKTFFAWCRWPIWFRPTMLVQFDCEPYGAFDKSYALTRAGDVLLVPTPGHTYGHQSVIVRDGAAGVDFLLAGDAAYDAAQVQRGEVAGFVADVRAARHTLRVLQQHMAQKPTVLLPSHDPDAAQRLQARGTVG